MRAAEPQTPPENGVHIGVDPHELPDFAAFKDIDAPWCPEMVVIPSGSFLMGSPEEEEEEEEEEEGRERCEGRQHRVNIRQRYALGNWENPGFPPVQLPLARPAGSYIAETSPTMPGCYNVTYRFPRPCRSCKPSVRL